MEIDSLALQLFYGDILIDPLAPLRLSDPSPRLLVFQLIYEYRISGP